jgi:NAD(P)-dependent dehydrogenase (short-subunit alcohol dehydrogenase family)
VTDDASVARAAEEVGAATGGQLDVLVNNAGIAPEHRPVEEVGPADFIAVFGVNVLGPVRVTRAFLPALRRSANPVVVNVSSGLGSFATVSDPGRIEHSVVGIVYPPSKSALNMITVQYAKALPGIKVNAVDPGYTATDLNGHSGPQTVEEGVEALVRMATVGPDGPTGTYVDRHGPLDW